MNLTVKIAKILKSRVVFMAAVIIAAIASAKIGLNKLERNHNDMWE